MKIDEKISAKERARRESDVNRGYRAGYSFVKTLHSLLESKFDQLRYAGKSEDYIENFRNAINDTTLEW